MLENDTILSVPTMDSEPRCDHCDAATALLYCRADSAKLCFACDRHVHSANAVFGRHTRSLLCESCAASPASIFCSDEASLLCHDCDWDAHRSSLLHHHRRPLEGFTACPDVVDFLAFLGFDDLEKKQLLEADLDADLEKGCDDFFMWDLVPCIDDAFVGLAAPDLDLSFQAIGVPPPPKNRNAVCGRYKEEVLRQLRELARDEPETNFRSVRKESLLGSEDLDLNSFRCEEQEANGFHQQFEGSSCQPIDDTVLQPNTDLGKGLWDSEKQSDLGDCLSQLNTNEQAAEDSKASTQGFHKVAAYEISSQERETAILRYKEKRKSRSFDKRIRYESRKVRAESRTRIKGRFAKIEHRCKIPNINQT